MPDAPDISLIPDLLVAMLAAFPRLAPLTVIDPDDGITSLEDRTHCAIVGLNRQDLLSRINAAFARLNVSVVVFIETAKVLNLQSKTITYDPVVGFIEITELVELNQRTPAMDPPGTGTGLEAWAIADACVSCLQNAPLTGLAKPYKVFIREPGIQNNTTQADAEAGCKVLRIPWETKAEGTPRD